MDFDPAKLAELVSKFGPTIVDKVRGIVEKIDRHEARAESGELFEEIAQQAKNEEYARLAKYTENRAIRAYIRMGIRLRQFESNVVERDRRRLLIRQDGGESALHLAEAVQCRILHLILEELEKVGKAGAAFNDEARKVLENIDRYTQFVREDMVESAAVTAVVAKIHGSYPPVFVIVGGGHAVKLAERIAKKVQGGLPHYVGRHVPLQTWRDAFVFTYDPTGIRAKEIAQEREVERQKRVRKARKRRSR